MLCRLLRPHLPNLRRFIISHAGSLYMARRSVYLVGFVVVGMVMALRAGETGYADTGIWHAQYLLFTPSMMFGVTMMAEYWVQCLPSQVRSTGRRVPLPRLDTRLLRTIAVHSSMGLMHWGNTLRRAAHSRDNFQHHLCDVRPRASYREIIMTQRGEPASDQKHEI